MKDHFSVNLGLHVYTFIPMMKDHLSYKTTFCGPMGVLKSQVSLYYIKPNMVLQYTSQRTKFMTFSCFFHGKNSIFPGIM